MSKNTRNRILLTAVAALLLVTMAVGGTLAWLTDTSEQVENTFTPTTIDVSLSETGATDNKKEFEMVPGRTLAKDPKVTLETGSQESYVFVEITQSANFETFMEPYVMSTAGAGWTLVEEETTTIGTITKVWMYNASVTGGSAPLQVLANDQVKVKETVTKAQMDALTADTYPTLTLKAYAIQTEIVKDKNWTNAQIWELAQTDGSVATPTTTTP